MESRSWKVGWNISLIYGRGRLTDLPIYNDIIQGFKSCREFLIKLLNNVTHGLGSHQENPFFIRIAYLILSFQIHFSFQFISFDFQRWA